MKHLFVLLFSLSILFAQSVEPVKETSETVLVLSESEFPVKFFDGEIQNSDIEICLESYQMSSQGFYDAITGFPDFKCYIRETDDASKFMIIFGATDLEGNKFLYYSYVIRS